MNTEELRRHKDKTALNVNWPHGKIDRTDQGAVSFAQGQVELAAAKAVTKALEQFPGFLNMKQGLPVAKKQFVKELGKRSVVISDEDFESFIHVAYNRGLEQVKQSVHGN
jgi:hypothetical protein